jgi:hypothetical protein
VLDFLRTSPRVPRRPPSCRTDHGGLRREILTPGADTGVDGCSASRGREGHPAEPASRSRSGTCRKTGVRATFDRRSAYEVASLVEAALTGTLVTRFNADRPQAEHLARLKHPSSYGGRSRRARDKCVGRPRAAVTNYQVHMGYYSDRLRRAQVVLRPSGSAQGRDDV